MEYTGPGPTDPLVRQEPPFEWGRVPTEMPRRVETAIPPELDPDVAMWPADVVSRWPFSGAPTAGVWPLGAAGIDNTGTMYVCTVGGSPGTWTAVGSGTSVQGTPIVRAFPFAYNTPGILTGAALYTPAVDDVLVEAWLSIKTAWNGTTPRGDFGSFTGGFGILNGTATGPWDMTNADVATAGTGYLFGGNTFASGTLPTIPVSQSTIQNPVGTVNPTFFRVTPGEFTAANPIKVCVSQDGTNTGANPGATQGAAVLYLVTATPVA